jgi:hypothetical protein
MDSNMEENTNCCSKNIEEQTEIQVTMISEIDFLVDKESQSQTRLDICKGCDQLLPIVNVCKQCGCLMNIKTRIYSSTCPLGKW